MGKENMQRHHLRAITGTGILVIFAGKGIPSTLIEMMASKQNASGEVESTGRLMISATWTSARFP